MSTECRDEPGGMSCRGGRLSYGKGKALRLRAQALELNKRGFQP